MQAIYHRYDGTLPPWYDSASFSAIGVVSHRHVSAQSKNEVAEVITKTERNKYFSMDVTYLWGVTARKKNVCTERKIPKISPSKYKPLKLVTQLTLR